MSIIKCVWGVEKMNKLKEWIIFQLFNKCPKCGNKLVGKGYDTIGVHYRKCLECGWGN